MKTEPITGKSLIALFQALTPNARKVINLQAVDMAVGRGVLEGDSRCLWTKAGHRITVVFTPDCLAVSESKEPDPEYQKLKEAQKVRGVKG